MLVASLIKSESSAGNSNERNYQDFKVSKTLGGEECKAFQCKNHVLLLYVPQILLPDGGSGRGSHSAL